MTIINKWGDSQKTIIHTIFDGNWTLEEYHKMIDEMHTMVLSVDHTVHFISDFSASRSSPAKLLSAGRHMENTKTKKRTGISVMVKADPFLKAIASVAQKMFLKDTKMYFCNSIEEAYLIAEKHMDVDAVHL